MKNKLIIAIVGLGLLAVSGYFTFRAYKKWRESNSVKMARETITKGDYNSGLLWLRKALQANPGNIEAVRMMGDFAELARLPNAVDWRERLVQLQPNNLTNRLALARVAIMARNMEVAKKALDGVDEAGKKTSDYQKSMGALDLATGNFLEAETRFGEASRLEPQNPAPKINYALMRMQRSDTNIAAQARREMEVLSGNPKVRVEALRHLTVDALAHTNLQRALAFSTDLVRETNAAFNDRILRLGVLQATQNPEFSSALNAARLESTNNLSKLRDMAIWHISNLGPSNALAWMRTLPMSFQTNQPVALISAECRMVLRDWAGLSSTIEKQNWMELEFLRYALKARALKGQNMDASSKAEWEKALKTAGDRKENILVLLRLSAQWNWRNEAETILWTIINRYPGEKWAFASLGQLLMEGNQTRPLMQLYSQQLKASPGDVAIMNNLAMTALLLDAQEIKPHDLARQVYEKAPTNASFASTYALSLHLQKKNADALKVIEKIEPKLFEDPSLAGYYGLILKANGNSAKAAKYFEVSAKGRFLPEEQKLIESAKSR